MEDKTSAGEVVWGVLIEDFDDDGNPIDLLNGQLFMNLGNPTPELQTKFFGDLEEDIVDNCIWPRLMYGDNAVENYLICTSLRGVCKAWMRYVEYTKAYSDGWEAWLAVEPGCADGSENSDSSSNYDHDF